MQRDFRIAILIVLGLLAVLGAMRDKERDFLKQTLTMGVK